MNDLIIPASEDERTPHVEFKKNGDLRITGKSIPENPIEFYEPIIKWIEELQKVNTPSIRFTVKLEYFNTASSKLLMVLFKTLEKIYIRNNVDVKIAWHYNAADSDMKETGKDYQSIIKVPFDYIEYKEDLL
jgi:hypothetical protein